MDVYNSKDIRLNPIKDDQFDSNLSSEVNDFLVDKLFAPIEEYLNRPRKDVRRNLVWAGYHSIQQEVTSRDESLLNDLAYCIEVLHSASLIVDDIQDNSQIRRESPCLHIQHGIPRAINAGNWLYFWTFKNLRTLDIDEALRNKMHNAIQDMLYYGHLGQALDLSEDVTRIPIEHISSISESCMRLKSGGLVGLSVELGALLAGANSEQTKYVREAGNQLGIILQMFDDLKNVKPKNRTGKFLEDLLNRRPNFIWSLAATHPDKECFFELHEAVKAMPQSDRFYQWCLTFNIFNRGFQAVETKFTDLISSINKQHQFVFRNKHFAEMLTYQYEKLRSSYDDE